MNLEEDYKCRIHESLTQKGMKGCTTYDCFGAGQKVTAQIYSGETWRTLTGRTEEIFDIYLTVFRMQQMLWFLTEAGTILPACKLQPAINKLMKQNRQVTSGSPKEILNFDLETYKNKVNKILEETGLLVKRCFKSTGNSRTQYMGKCFRGRSFDGADFSMSLLIAADFSGCSFHGADFLGADTRDTNFAGADLREAIFLTQAQLNGARGSGETKLPRHLDRPAAWTW